MGFTSPSVVLCPKRAAKWVLAAQHNSSIRKLDLCFPVTHSSFSVHVPSILSLSSIGRHFSRGLCSSFGPSDSLPFPPTRLKAAQHLSCNLPGGFHHTSHGIVSHVPSSPCVWSHLLSALQLRHLSLAFRSPASEQQRPQLLEQDAAGSCPPRVLLPGGSRLSHAVPPGSGKPALPSPVMLAGRCRVCPRLTPSDGLQRPREHVFHKAVFRLRVSQSRLGNPRADGWV